MLSSKREGCKNFVGRHNSITERDLNFLDKRHMKAKSICEIQFNILRESLI